MSFISTLNSGVSGMRAAQAALAVSSQNIANANTPGYVRAEVNLVTQSIAGRGGGVLVDSITRAADRFLAASYYTARGAESAASGNASLMDRLQALFGDPNSDNSTFGIVDSAYRALADAGTDPASPVARREAVASLRAAFDELQRVGGSMEALRQEADLRISESVSRADSLIGQIHQLNSDVAVSRGVGGGDSTGAENIRGTLVDELAGIIDIRVMEKADGKLEIRTNSGFSLVGVDRVRLSYEPSTGEFTLPNSITATPVSGEAYAMEPHIASGELAGLLKARDIDIPDLAEGLGTFADALADELNRLHTVQTSQPPPRSIEGRDTGLLSSDAHGFSGKAIVAVLTENGRLYERVTIDFDAGEMKVEDPAQTFTFGSTIGDLATTLASALGTASATASFSNGVMKIEASAGYGLAFGEVDGDESNRAGRGFAHTFGLNELARRPMAPMFETGIQTSDAHGLVAGGALTLRITDQTGRVVGDRTVSVTGTTWADMTAALNAPISGVGPYAAVSLDAKGKMTIAPAAGFRVHVVGDSTERGGAGGPSVSDVFGLAPGALARRAMTINVNPEIVADSRRLGVADTNLSVKLGDRALEAGDGRGAAALANVRNTTVSFGRAGQIGAHTSTLGVYATRVGAEAGRLSVLSQRSADSATAIAKVALERRSSVEAVSIDDEVIRMNAYQQAYAASARMIQAANEMWQTLLSIR